MCEQCIVPANLGFCHSYLSLKKKNSMFEFKAKYLWENFLIIPLQQFHIGLVKDPRRCNDRERRGAIYI